MAIAVLSGISVIFFIWAGVATVRLLLYKKQVRHMLKELELAKSSDTNAIFTSAVKIGQTQQVIDALNCVLEKYRRKTKRLLRENQSYRESIASISHDIRTPLTSAKGYMQMIQKDGLSMEKKMQYAKTVERRLADLSDMLEQLFLYARMEAGELTLHPQLINACGLFADTISMFYEDFCKKNCEPSIELPSLPCWLFVDRQAFIRVIENLVKNALAHGNGNYRMSLRKEGKTAVLCVSNETDSIAQSDICHIFDRFYTTDRSTSRKTTGLGLSIVKGLAGQMGGEVDARLEGKVFSIEMRLPCAAEKQISKPELIEMEEGFTPFAQSDMIKT